MNLPFLDKFVATALEAGATPFIPKDQRMKADMDEINAAAASAGNMGLRFEAYQLTTAGDPSPPFKHQN